MLGSSILNDTLQRIIEEARTENSLFKDCLSDDHIRSSYQNKKWSTRQKELEADFDESRDNYFHAFIKSHGISINLCSHRDEQIPGPVIKCNTCRDILCERCDLIFHSKRPFHYRLLFVNEKIESRPLLPVEFANEDGSVKRLGKILGFC